MLGAKVERKAEKKVEKKKKDKLYPKLYPVEWTRQEEGFPKNGHEKKG